MKPSFYPLKKNSRRSGQEQLPLITAVQTVNVWLALRALSPSIFQSTYSTNTPLWCRSDCTGLSSFKGCLERSIYFSHWIFWTSSPKWTHQRIHDDPISTGGIKSTAQSNFRHFELRSWSSWAFPIRFECFYWSEISHTYDRRAAGSRVGSLERRAWKSYVGCLYVFGHLIIITSLDMRRTLNNRLPFCLIDKLGKPGGIPFNLFPRPGSIDRLLEVWLILGVNSKTWSK